MQRQDMEHMLAGYALLKDAIDQIAQVYEKDATIAHAYRVLGAIEDTIYQYVTTGREK